MVRHVIMWKFRQGTETQMQEFVSKLQALDGIIPEILHMQIGINCKDGNNYEACLIADFADFDALERYKNDPRHVAVSQLCKTIRESRGAVDFIV